MLTAVVVMLALILIFQANRASGPLHAAHLITERLELRDDDAVTRLPIEQDPPGTGRQSRVTGIILYDRHGHERGGLVTYDDDREALALDAGVGAGYDDSLRDRLGLSVSADGAASVLLTDNLTRGVVRLHSDGDGGGGVQTMKWDMEARRIHLRTSTYDGDVLSEQAFGEPE
ncbi:MAG: hypothetical protein ACI4NW_08885 [Stenotrophomonas sp.]